MFTNEDIVWLMGGMIVGGILLCLFLHKGWWPFK